MSAAHHALASRAVQRELWPDAAVEHLRFRRAPLLVASLCFAAGIVLARNWQPPIILLLSVAGLAGLTLLGLRGRVFASLVAVSALWMAVGLWSAEIQPPIPSQQTFHAYADGLSRTVRGQVVRVRQLPPLTKESDSDADPTTWVETQNAGQPQTLAIDLAIESVEEVTPDLAWMTPVAGGVRVTIVGHSPDLHCGDRLEAPLRMKVPERYHDPGAWQYADFLLEQGVGTHANVKAAKLVRLPRSTSTWTRSALQCRLFAAQSWAAEQMVRYVHSPADQRLPAPLRLSPDDAGMLNAMLFGDRTHLTHSLRLGFERTGSFHLFVVSGMHVALLASAVFWLTRKLRLGELHATLLTIALTAAYALLTGFGAPVQRALAMATVFLLTRLLFRQRSVLNALGAAVLAVLVWSPRSLFEASFQMTFLSIVAIAGIAVPLGERSFLSYARATRKLDDVWLDVRLIPRLAQLRVMLRLWGEAIGPFLGKRSRALFATGLRWILWVIELTLIGVVAEMLMVLPMAIYFHRATVFALPANMLSIPMVAILAPLAILTFLASLFNPWLALLPGAATALLLHGIVGLIHRVSRAQFADTRVPGPALWIACGVVACWLFCCWAVRRSGRWALVAVAVLPLAAAVILWPEPPVSTRGSLELTAIDVGQGDSILVVSPAGDTMLVDAGGPTGAIKESAEATSRFDVGEQVVSPYLWSRRFRRLDVLVLSHAHSDHMGGMAAVMRSFHPRELWVSIDPDSNTYRALLLEAQQIGVTIRHFHGGDSVAWAGTQVEVLAPEADYQNLGAPTNNDSLVLRVDYGRASILLEGDAEAASEKAMLASGRMRPVTLLKVGHHGSRTSTNELFFQALAPADAVISVGKDNTFGHPRAEVIERMAHAGTRVYRTDEFGLTTFLLQPDGTLRTVLAAGDAGAWF
jgi:competence protein ComEC